MTQTHLISKIILVILFVNAFCFSIRVDAQTWQYVGLDGYRVEHVYAKGDTIWAGTVDSMYQRAIQYSFTGGRDWFKVSDTDTAFGGWLELAQVDPRYCRTIYAIDKKKRGLRSTDAGASWEVLWDDLRPQPWPKRVKSILVSPHNEKLIFCIVGQVRTGGVLDELYRSTDGGKTWDFVGGYFASSSHGLDLQLAFDPVDTLKIYATGYTSYDTRFYLSTNSGMTWNYRSYCNAQRILTTKIGRIFLYPKIYQSSDEGSTWITLDSARYAWENWLPWHLIVHPTNDSILFGLGIYPSNAVRMSVDQGNTWKEIPGSQMLKFDFTSDYSLLRVKLLSIDPINDRLYVATNGKGIYQSAIVVSVSENYFKPSNLQLYFNYPNPFTRNTTIIFSLTKREHVKLIVQDIFGRVVKTLVNEFLSAGNYSIPFYANTLNVGIYFSTFIVGDRTITKRMFLMK